MVLLIVVTVPVPIIGFFFYIKEFHLVKGGAPGETVKLKKPFPPGLAIALSARGQSAEGLSNSVNSVVVSPAIQWASAVSPCVSSRTGSYRVLGSRATITEQFKRQQ